MVAYGQFRPWTKLISSQINKFCLYIQFQTLHNVSGLVVPLSVEVINCFFKMRACKFASCLSLPSTSCKYLQDLQILLYGLNVCIEIDMSCHV